MHLHAHSHAGQPGVARPGNARRMAVALAVNVAMVVTGATGALLTGSLALLAEAGHVMSDALSIALALAAAKVASRPATRRGTFGMGRVEIFAALLNGLVLVAVAVYVAVAAIGRLSGGHAINGLGVLLFGAAELVGNVVATVVLAGGDRVDVNLEGVLRHSFADALGALGVIAAGAGIALTGWQRLDPIVGLVLALVIVASSWRLIREPLEVLLERTPAGLDSVEIGGAIVAVEGVREVHDLHVWSITSGFPALAAHVVVKATHEPDAVRGAIERMLDDRFSLTHTTLQVSREPLLQIEPAGDGG